jgi:hypothetical protein
VISRAPAKSFTCELISSSGLLVSSHMVILLSIGARREIRC